jgi:hypothetical protein
VDGFCPSCQNWTTICFIFFMFLFGSMRPNHCKEHNGGRVAVVQIRASLVPAVAYADVVLLHSASLPCCSRFAAISQNFSFISTPIARSPRSLAERLFRFCVFGFFHKFLLCVFRFCALTNRRT